MGMSRDHILQQSLNGLWKFTPAEKSRRRDIRTLFKYSLEKDVQKKTYSVHSLNRSLDKWVIEEGVHVSAKFLKNDKKLRSAGKKWAALNFQLHRILKKLIEDHINTKNRLERYFPLADV